MDPAETADFLSYLKLAYPGSKLEASVPMVKMWHRHTYDIPPSMSLDLADYLISTNVYPPTPAHLREAYAKAIADANNELTAGEAWALVSKKIRYYGHDRPTEARTELGEFLWDVIGQTGGWYQICLSEEPQIVCAQFERHYNQMIERTRFARLVPAQIRDGFSQTLLKMTGQPLMIEGGDDHGKGRD